MISRAEPWICGHRATSRHRSRQDAYRQRGQAQSTCYVVDVLPDERVEQKLGGGSSMRGQLVLFERRVAVVHGADEECRILEFDCRD